MWGEVIILVGSPRKLLFTTGFLLSGLLSSTAHKDAVTEFEVASLSKSLLMATSPSDLDVYLYSSDYLTVLDHNLQVKPAFACELNASNLFYKSGRFHCNDYQESSIKINCESSRDSFAGIEHNANSKMHAYYVLPRLIVDFSDLRLNCMHRVIQFEDLDLEIPVNSQYLYSHKGPSGTLLSVILRQTDNIPDENDSEVITELHMHTMEFDAKKWQFQNSRILKCVRTTNDNLLRVFEEATAAIIILQERSDEQLADTSENFLYVSFVIRTNETDEQENIKLRTDSSVCRFHLDDLKVPEEPAANEFQWRVPELAYFPGETVLSLRPAVLDSKPLLVVHQRQLISLINISWKTPKNSDMKRELEFKFNETNTTHVRQVETSLSSIYALTDTKLFKINTDRCGQFHSCYECVSDSSNKNAFCGWCTLEKRCSTQTSCQSAFEETKNETLAKLWISTWSHEPIACPEIKLRNPGWSVAVDKIPVLPRQQELSTQVRDQRQFPVHQAPASLTKPFEVTFSADGLPGEGGYIKHIFCEFGFCSTGNATTERTKAWLRSKKPALARNFHCEIPAEIEYKTFRNRPNKPVESRFRVSLVHRMADREGGKHELATSEIRLIYCATVDSCNYCKTQDVCFWNTGRCKPMDPGKGNLRPDKTEDCPDIMAPAVVSTALEIVQAVCKGQTDNLTSEIVLYPYNLRDDADLSDLLVTAGKYPCQNLTRTGNQTLTCAFTHLDDTAYLTVVVQNRTSKALVKCKFCEPFRNSTGSDRPNSGLDQFPDILFWLAVTLGPIAFLVLLILVIEARDKVREERLARERSGRGCYQAVEKDRSNTVIHST